jgi:Effector-associated domain 11
MPEISIKIVRELLADGQTEAACDKLLELTKSAKAECYDTALLLKNRLETLQQQVIEGVISHADEGIQWARISKGIVELTTQIERGEVPKWEEEIVHPKSQAKSFFARRAVLWTIPAIIILGVFVFRPMFTKKTAKDRPKPAIEMKLFKGNVRHINGKPASFATVVFEHELLGTRRSTTDIQGFFEIKLPAKVQGEKIMLTIIHDSKEKLKRTLSLEEIRLKDLKIHN